MLARRRRCVRAGFRSLPSDLDLARSATAAVASGSGRSAPPPAPGMTDALLLRSGWPEVARATPSPGPSPSSPLDIRRAPERTARRRPTPRGVETRAASPDLGRLRRASWRPVGRGGSLRRRVGGAKSELSDSESDGTRARPCAKALGVRFPPPPPPPPRVREAPRQHAGKVGASRGRPTGCTSCRAAKLMAVPASVKNQR